MERIAYYAVIELAVRVLAMCFKTLFRADCLLFCFHIPDILVLFRILVSVYSSNIWDLRFRDCCHTRGA